MMRHWIEVHRDGPYEGETPFFRLMADVSLSDKNALAAFESNKERMLQLDWHRPNIPPSARSGQTPFYHLIKAGCLGNTTAQELMAKVIEKEPEKVLSIFIDFYLSNRKSYVFSWGYIHYFIAQLLPHQTVNWNQGYSSDNEHQGVTPLLAALTAYDENLPENIEHLQTLVLKQGLNWNAQRSQGPMKGETPIYRFLLLRKKGRINPGLSNVMTDLLTHLIYHENIDWLQPMMGNSAYRWKTPFGMLIEIAVRDYRLWHCIDRILNHYSEQIPHFIIQAEILLRELAVPERELGIVMLKLKRAFAYYQKGVNEGDSKTLEAYLDFNKA